MATLIIEYDLQSKPAKELILFIKKSGLVKIQKSSNIKPLEKIPNKTTLKAMDDKSNESEKVFYAVSALLKDLNS